MSDTGGNKQISAHEKAQREYLTAGKKYSSLLKGAMDLDPNIVKIAEEILVVGDTISVHDNKLLTRFYNELRAGSKIDKKYYELLIGLKKAKNELDIATDHLLARRVGKILTEAGIPPKEAKLSEQARVSRLNNPDIGFLEKISLPGVLPLDLATELERLVSSGELNVDTGKLTPKTKVARDFLKNAEREIRERANEEFLLGSVNSFSDVTPSADILDLVKAAGDKDHIRELERRIDAGDISLANGSLRAVTARGTKYLKLLTEELCSLAAKKADSRLMSTNQNYIEKDPRLTRAKKAVDSLHDNLRKHDRFLGLTENTSYNDLISKAQDQEVTLNAKLSRVLTEVETISRAFLDIKKRVISVAGKKEVDVPGLISLLVASRHLSRFEIDYHRDLADLESTLGIVTKNDETNFGPAAGHLLAESYCQPYCQHLDQANSIVRELVSARIASRKSLNKQMEKVLADFVLSPKQIEPFKDILCEQEAIKKHISNALYAGGSLYEGIGGLSSLIEELVELEVEKREKIADFVHEFELAHKELWLASIKNSNRNFISDNFPDLAGSIKGNADTHNNELVSYAREHIREVIDRYRAEHRSSSESFGAQLKASLEKLKKDGDVVTASTQLKNEFKKMTNSHDKALNSLEMEIGVLERKLDEFESVSKKDLQKTLLTDIRKNI